MTARTFRSPTFLACALLAACLASPWASAATMAKPDYNAGKERIKATEKSERDACKTVTGNAKDVCVEEAKAKARVGLAELEYAYTAKPRDQAKIVEVRAEAAYAVAKERCDDQTGNAKDVCVKQAKATQDKAKADATLNQKVSAARKDANEDKREADYKVATQRCDAMAGAPKDACVAEAKARFGKS